MRCPRQTQHVYHIERTERIRKTRIIATATDSAREVNSKPKATNIAPSPSSSPKLSSW
jgi:hypothetical protein